MGYRSPRLKSRYFKCVNCANLKFKKIKKRRKNPHKRKYGFICVVWKVKYDTIVKNYKNYRKCIYYVPKPPKQMLRKKGDDR